MKQTNNTIDKLWNKATAHKLSPKDITKHDTDNKIKEGINIPSNIKEAINYPLKLMKLGTTNKVVTDDINTNGGNPK